LSSMNKRSDIWNHFEDIGDGKAVDMLVFLSKNLKVLDYN